MASRKSFGTDEVIVTLRNFPPNVSGCEDSWSEFDDLYILELDYFSAESEHDISGSVCFGAHLPDRPAKRPRIKNQANRIEADQETDYTDATINAIHSKEKSDSNLELAPDSSQFFPRR